MVVYEFPFHEGVRTLLRIEHLLDRLGTLVARDSPVDHHHALATLFEIMDVAARADLKSDLLKELERHRGQYAALRGHPGVAEATLASVIGQLESAIDGLAQTQGKAGQALSSNEWLMAIKSRISIPGGTCSFDLPAYHAWQQLDAPRRRADLHPWLQTLAPMGNALRLLLALVRDSGQPQRMLAVGGQYQQALSAAKTFQLLRLQVARELELVPEISGHRLMVSVRFMRAAADGRLRPAGDDTPFDLALCN